MVDQWNHKVFSLEEAEFEQAAIDIFRLQSRENPVYKTFIDFLGLNPGDINSLREIPFLPIRFFKTHTVQTTDFEPTLYFESSGTTGSVNSRHYIKDVSIYDEGCVRNFEFNYGLLNEWCVLGLLPSYLEKGHSSLVYMVDRFIQLTKHQNSGFYLHDYEKLVGVIKEQEQKKSKTMLIGVTYALLDLAEKNKLSLHNTTIMETGGMKGRRKEMIRTEVHEKLKLAFDVDIIHSEYGMTELLSQAYSKADGIFQCPAWMKLLIRDEEDPFLIQDQGTGIINIIDLANIYSCSFIATDDAGRLFPDGSFEVLGRVDGSDIRGCSLLTI